MLSNINKRQKPSLAGIILKSTEEKVNVLQHIIYMDESGKEGKFYGNFYGGALIRSTDLLQTIEELSHVKQSLNLNGEVKWQKVTSQYLDKYLQLPNDSLILLRMTLLK